MGWTPKIRGYFQQGPGHKNEETLAAAFAGAELTALLVPADLSWDIATALAALAGHQLFTTSAALVEVVAGWARAGDALLVMSNGAFDNIHTRLLAALETRP